MSRLIIHFSAVALCAAALVGPLAVTPSEAKTGRHAHVVKHRWHQGHHHHYRGHHYARGGWAVGNVSRTGGFVNDPGPICPGLGRSFDCKIWPPPIDIDPDRKIGRP